MPYLPTLNAFLHSASLLLTAYPTARITTKYSLPRAPKESPAAPAATTDAADNGTQREKKEPSATLTVKVFHPATGICLKYETDKAQEVGRLITSLGRLARGEAIETAAPGGDAAADKMDVDAGPAVAVKQEDAVAAGKPVGQQQQQQGQGQSGGGGGGGKKKKKGKK